nr:Transcription factor bye1 like [Ipomoea batatas]
MAKKSSPSWQSGLPTSNTEKDVPRREAPDSRDNRSVHSHFLSGGSRLKDKHKYEKDKNISRKRPYHSSGMKDLPSSFRYSDSRLPNDSNAENYEPTPKKRTSDSDGYVNSSSGMHSWDAMLQKRSNVQEDKHMPEEKGSGASNCVDSWQQNKKVKTDDGKDMPEKKGSGSGDCWNTHSNLPSWDPWLQKETNADKGNNKHEKNISTSGDIWNSHSSWPSWDSWLQKDTNADKGKDMNDKTCSASRDRWNSHSSWPSWPQKKSGAEDSKHMSQNRVSGSGDHVRSHCHRPPWKSRWDKSSDFRMDKALVHEGGHNSSNGASRQLSPRSRLPVKTIAKETNDSTWKSSNSSSDYLQLSSSRHGWKSELQIRSNVEGLKNILEERSSTVIKSLKEDGLKAEVSSTKAGPQKRGQSSADGAKLHSEGPNWESRLQSRCYKGDSTDSPGNSSIWEGSNEDVANMKPNNLIPNTIDLSGSPSDCAGWEVKKRSNVENTNNRSVERAETKVCPRESLQERSDSTGGDKDGLLKGAYNSIGVAESPCALPQNSNVQKSKDPKEVKNRFRKKAVDLCDHPLRNLEEQRVEDAHEARDVHNKGVSIGLDSQECTNEVGFDKIDGEGLPHGRVSWDSRTQIPKDGLLEVSTSTPMKGNDTSTLRAFNMIDAAELPSDRTSGELRIMQRGKEQVKDGSNEKLPNRIDSTELQSSWYSHEPDVQIRSNLEEPKGGSNKKESNRIYSTELQSILHSRESNMQRTNLEEPKAQPNESHVQRKGTLEEPKNIPDERIFKGTNGADCPSMLPCVESKLQRSISVEEIEVSPREQTSDPTHGVQFPFISVNYMQKGNMRASEITDGAEFPSTSHCKDLRLQRSIAAKEIKVSSRKEASNLVHDVEFPFISRGYKLQKGSDEDAKDIHGEKASNLIVGSTFPLNRPVLELKVESKRNTEGGDIVEGKVAVPISQSTTQIRDFNVLSCSKDFNEIAHCNRLHISHGIFTSSQNCPAEKDIWMGSFKVTDIASVVRFYEGLTAHPSSKVCRRAYEFAKKMPSTVDFLIHPRCNYWSLIFEGCPDTNDIALYFYPRNKEAKNCYSSLLRFIDNKDLMLRSQIGHVELLVFPSRLLDVRCRTIENQYFFWGVFHTKRWRNVQWKTNLDLAAGQIPELINQMHLCIIQMARLNFPKLTRSLALLLTISSLILSVIPEAMRAVCSRLASLNPVYASLLLVSGFHV